jgi:hypothetical protein
VAAKEGPPAQQPDCIRLDELRCALVREQRANPLEQEGLVAKVTKQCLKMGTDENRGGLREGARRDARKNSDCQ